MTAPGRKRFVLWVLVACALTAGDAALSHEFTMKGVMNAFVRLEPREAHLVLRVPLYVLSGIRFPLRGREIDLAAAGPALQGALQEVARDVNLSEEGQRLVPSKVVGRLSLPSDRSFEQYEGAVAHVAQPVDPATSLYSDQAYVDAHVTYRIASPASRFSIRTEVAPELKDYLKLTVRFLPMGDRARPLVITSRSGTVPLNPSWHQAARGFVALGVGHILSGADHLLFLLCLVIPLAGLRQVVPTVTAFTVAHTFTLIGSVYDLGPAGAWFPPFVETAIAASIVYMALENITGAGLQRRWMIAGLFGLVHGFGFSYALRDDLQFAGRHLLVSLLSFNLGIELGQLTVLALVLPVLALLRRRVLAGRVGVIVLSAIVAHTGWHWMLDRGEALLKAPWPRPDSRNIVALAIWVAALVFAGWSVRFVARRAGAWRGPRRIPLETGR